MPSEHRLSTIPHCLEWYKRVLRTHLFTLAVQYPKASDVTDVNLNRHGLVFDELTNGRTVRTHLLLVNAYVRVVT